MTKLCPRGKAAAKRKFKVYPSAYANAYASKICAGKIKDPSGVKRKDFKGRKPSAMGGRIMAAKGFPDLSGDGKIIKGIWIAPKLYCLQYVYRTKDNKFAIDTHYVGKGMNKSKLSIEQYENMLKGEQLENIGIQFKKTFIKRNKKQLKKNIKQFSVSVQPVKKIINKIKWKGRLFKNNISVPHGYDTNNLIECCA